MRQTIGGSWIFMLAIIFTLLFAAYIALTINYSKSFKVKNEVISLLEKSEGATMEGIGLINNFLAQSGYLTTGKCGLKIDSDYVVHGTYGVKSLDYPANANTVEIAQEGKEYYYCFTKYSNYHKYFKTRGYYKIKLFFRFDLPVMGRIGVFDVDGQTSEIDYTYDSSALNDWNK